MYICVCRCMYVLIYVCIEGSGLLVSREEGNISHRVI